jgi:hypothetical protein
MFAVAGRDGKARTPDLHGICIPAADFFTRAWWEGEQH